MPARAVLVVAGLLSALSVVAVAGAPAAGATPIGTVGLVALGQSDPEGIAAGPDGNLWFANYLNSSIGRITPTGEVSTFADVGIKGPAGIVAGADGNLWFTNQTANTIGRITTAGVVSTFTGVGIGGPHGIAAGPDGNLWFTNLATNRIGRITTAGVVSTFTGAGISLPTGIAAGPDGNLWFTNDNDSIGRITTAGVVSTFTGAGISGPEGITAGPDGNLWFTNFGGGSIGRITTTGVVSTFPDAAIVHPWGITAGGDGNLWFASKGNDVVGKITTAGVVSTFAAAGSSRPTGIAAGPDGNLWFTSAGNDAIGRISPAGVVATFTGSGLSTPEDIAAGPDGSWWFTNTGQASIGRVTAAGVASSFTGPGITSPLGITAGPDGNLWFTNWHDASIGRITPGGVVTVFTDPGIAEPREITAGPDGNLWFTNGFRSIGRITTAGVVSTFTAPGISYPSGITAGPDGNLWFTNFNDSSIGRMTTAGAATFFKDPGIDGPVGITAGPDGDVWFTNEGGMTNVLGPSVGRITVTGVVSSVYDARISTPLGIAAGPDGNLWFTNMGSWTAAPSIGRITPAGVVSTFTGLGLSSPKRITAGPGGEMWFTNSGGNSIGRVTAAALPDAPAKPSATADLGAATVSWVAPADGGSPISGYVVTAYQGGVASGQTCATGGALSCQVTGLTPGVAFTFTVHATNGVGAGPESPPSDPVVPAAPTVPAAPPKPLASAGVEQATVTWSAPADGGSPITGYVVTAYQGGVASGQTCSWTSGPLTCAVTGLSDGTAYTFTVRAANVVGPSLESPPSDAVTTPSVPSAPAKPTATRGNTDAVVSWTAPADGGSAITGYTVTAYQGGSASGQTCGAVPPATTCDVTGLTNGTPYTFTVKAINAVGVGPESDPSDAVTPIAGDLFHPLDAPTRILDSRPPPEQVGPYSTPWAAGTIRDVQVAGVGGVPANATAVTLTVTVTGTTAASFLTIWPKGDPQPTASNLNWSAGQTIPNAVTVKVGAEGKVQVFNPSGSATVIVDVVGYYDQSGSGAGFTSQAPARVLDSRPAPETVGPYSTPWAAGTDRDVTVAGVAGVPADAEAVVANVTVTGTSAESFLTVYPNGATKPTASSLNWKAGVTIPNAVTVKVGTGGKIRVFNNSGAANVIIDVVGYFKTGSGDAFHPLSPVRFQDSRPAPETVGAYSTPWGTGVSRTVSVLTGGAVPAGAKAVLANFTVTSTSAESFATVWNTGATKPTASSLNWKAGTTIANAVTAKVGDSDTISVFNNSGTVNVIADVGGWYG